MINNLFKLNDTKPSEPRAGFALPTILLASTVLMIVVVMAAVTLISMNTAVRNSYYSQVATAAAESGLVKAETCLKANNNTPSWTNSNPIGPNTDCTGAVSAACMFPSPPSTCYVLIDTNVKSTFAVTFTNSNSGVIDLHSTSQVSTLRSSNSATVASYQGVEDEHLQGSGTFIEYTIPVAGGAAQPLGIGVGSDGAIWFTEVETVSPFIGRLTVTGGNFTEYTLPTTNNPRPGRIINGNDNFLYVTEYNANLIARINVTNGNTNEYGGLSTCPGGFLNLSQVSSEPEGISQGPSGDNGIWFTEYYCNQIGRIPVGGGSVTQYPIPTANSYPHELTVGPGGVALWFTEGSGNKIGRLTTTGVFTEYTIPTSSANPIGITSGPDGALWFTENSGNKIGRVTTSGTFSEYPIPTSNGQPVDIISGPDGALWFTENNGNKLGRITVNGTITEYAVPTSNSQPFGIVSGPDGALWFTENSGNKIGRYGLPLSEGRNIY